MASESPIVIICSIISPSFIIFTVGLSKVPYKLCMGIRLIPYLALVITRAVALSPSFNFIFPGILTEILTWKDLTPPDAVDAEATLKLWQRLKVELYNQELMDIFNLETNDSGIIKDLDVLSDFNSFKEK